MKSIFFSKLPVKSQELNIEQFLLSTSMQSLSIIREHLFDHPPPSAIHHPVAIKNS